MADINSKNMYAALGNDPEYDSDREPEPPTKAIEKPTARSGKRDAPKAAPGEGAAPTGPRRNANERTGGFSDGDRSFRDRTNRRHPNAGNYVNANTNRDHPVEHTDGTVRGRDSGPGTQRGGRGPRGPRRGGDRHVNRTGRGDHAKQVAHGWGEQTGEGEQEDEKQGEALAQEDKKEEIQEDAAAPDEAAPEPEPEDTSVSYADYLAQQAQKKLEGLGLKEARAPNEGAKDNKKWKNATALEKTQSEEAYFEGQAKAKRERERANKKQLLDIDYAFKEQPREGGRGGRGDGRGGRGRGRGEGGRGGRGRGDGDFRPRGGDRGSFRGGRGRSNDQPAPGLDNSAFPALGGN